jgi:cell division protein FtsQ
VGRHRRPFLVVAALLAVAGLIVFLWTGPLLAVGEVRVDGTTILPAEQVLQVAGVARGTPLLQVDVAGAGARVADLPQVASVEVTRGWPNSVVITVVERTPVAVVEQAGRRTLIDGEGVPFDTISGEPPAGVVALDVADPGPDDPATEAALSAIVALPDRVRERLVEVTARSPREITLRLDGGTTVLWGSGDKAAEKATVLTALLQQIESGSLEAAGTLDVSTPGAVVLR